MTDGMRLGTPESHATRVVIAIVAGAVLAGAIAASLALVTPSVFPRRPVAQKLLLLDAPIVLDRPAR